jgi:hypothetical protein
MCPSYHVSLAETKLAVALVAAAPGDGWSSWPGQGLWQVDRL